MPDSPAIPATPLSPLAPARTPPPLPSPSSAAACSGPGPAETGLTAPLLQGTELPRVPAGDAPVVHSMREQEEAITSLKKENFNLKLRIYHMEDHIRQMAPGKAAEAVEMVCLPAHIARRWIARVGPKVSPGSAVCGGGPPPPMPPPIGCPFPAWTARLGRVTSQCAPLLLWPRLTLPRTPAAGVAEHRAEDAAGGTETRA